MGHRKGAPLRGRPHPGQGRRAHLCQIQLSVYRSGFQNGYKALQGCASGIGSSEPIDARPEFSPGGFWGKETQMESNIKLGRLFGVKIGLHYSWIIIALLIAFSLATRFQTMHPDWGDGVAWLTAIITAALFFASIIVHELSHAMVAKMRGLPVHSITLFAFGGVAKIEKEA